MARKLKEDNKKVMELPKSEEVITPADIGEVKAKDLVNETPVDSTAKAAKAPKVKKEAPTGVSVKVLADKLGTTPFKLREFLRKNFAGINGGKGKGYNFTDIQVKEIIEAFKVKAVKATEPKVKKEKSKGKTKEVPTSIATAVEAAADIINDLGEDLDSL